MSSLSFFFLFEELFTPFGVSSGHTYQPGSHNRRTLTKKEEFSGLNLPFAVNAKKKNSQRKHAKYFGSFFFCSTFLLLYSRQFCRKKGSAVLFCPSSIVKFCTRQEKMCSTRAVESTELNTTNDADRSENNRNEINRRKGPAFRRSKNK